jgi:hypothetical protein
MWETSEQEIGETQRVLSRLSKMTRAAFALLVKLTWPVIFIFATLPLWLWLWETIGRR